MNPDASTLLVLTLFLLALLLIILRARAHWPSQATMLVPLRDDLLAPRILATPCPACLKVHVACQGGYVHWQRIEAFATTFLESLRPEPRHHQPLLDTVGLLTVHPACGKTYADTPCGPIHAATTVKLLGTRQEPGNREASNP